MDLAPIVLFGYNRPEHLRRTASALSRNEMASDSDLIVRLDGAGGEHDLAAVTATRRVAAEIDGFASVQVEARDDHAGLSRSIIEGVSSAIEAHGRAIIVEDDLVTSPFFLRFHNEALALYEEADRVIGISGFTYPHRGELPPTFFLRSGSTWGWSTWARGWARFEPDGAHLLATIRERGLVDAFDVGGYPYTRMLEGQAAGAIDSWAIRWYASGFLGDAITLFPGESLVQNVGFDGSGTHPGRRDLLQGRLAEGPVTVAPIPLEVDPAAQASFAWSLRRERRADRLRRFWPFSRR